MRFFDVLQFVDMYKLAWQLSAQRWDLQVAYGGRLSLGIVCAIAQLAAWSLMTPPVIAQQPAAFHVGLQRNVQFTEYPSIAHGAELLRRLSTPLTVLHASRRLAQSGTSLQAEVISLAQERYVLYVPSLKPAKGYGLLVFVPPWSDASVPLGWTSPLDRSGIIFVSAAGSGNDVSITGRREPLALVATANIIQHYPIDPQRIYIAGFSGGSRVALRVALAYPDVFHGVLLNAGSDPIGNAQAPLPPADLFEQFQSLTRIVYVTGDADATNIDSDGSSMQSMQRWCVYDVHTEEIAHAGHAVADQNALRRALSELSKHDPPDPGKLASCRLQIDKAVNDGLRKVEDLLMSGKIRDASKALEAVDLRYGGLAAPRSVELAERIERGKP